MEDPPDDLVVSHPSEISSCNGELQSLPEEVVIILNQGPFDQEQPTQDLTVARYVAVAGENGCTFELIPESARQHPRNDASQQDISTLETTISNEQSFGESSTKPSISASSESHQGIDEISVELVKDLPKTEKKSTTNDPPQRKYHKNKTSFNTAYSMNKAKMTSIEKLDDTSDKCIPFREKLKLMTQLRDEGKLKCPVEGCNEEFEKIRLYQIHIRHCTSKGSHSSKDDPCPHCGAKLSAIPFKTLEEHIMASHPEKNEAATGSTLSGSTEITQTPVKRKRGRPPKSDKKTIPPESKESSEEPKIKRKRGRPPLKDKKPPSSDIDLNRLSHGDSVNEILSSTSGLLASSKELLSSALESSPSIKKKDIQPNDSLSSDSEGDIVEVDQDDRKLAYNPSIRQIPRRKPLIDRGVKLKFSLIENASDPSSLTSFGLGGPRGIRRVIDNINRQFGVNSHPDASKALASEDSSKGSQPEGSKEDNSQGEASQSLVFGESSKTPSTEETPKRIITKSPASGLQKLIENIHKQRQLILSPSQKPISKDIVSKVEVSRNWGSARKTYPPSLDYASPSTSNQNAPIKAGRGRPRKVVEKSTPQSVLKRSQDQETAKDSSIKPKYSVRFEKDPKILNLDDSIDLNLPNDANLNTSLNNGPQNNSNADSSIALTNEKGTIVKEISCTSILQSEVALPESASNSISQSDITLTESLSNPIAQSDVPLKESVQNSLSQSDKTLTESVSSPISQSDVTLPEAVSNPLSTTSINETFESLKEPFPLFTDPPTSQEMISAATSEAQEKQNDDSSTLDDNSSYTPINPFPNLEEPNENDSNNLNENQTSLKPESPSKPVCKPIKRLSNSFLKKIANKVVHDIYQLPPLCAKKEEISMESFIESPKYDNVVFSSLTNIRGKPLRKQPSIYLKNSANNSTPVKPMPSSNLDHEANDEMDQDNTDFSDLPPEDIEEAKKKLYYAFRWSKGKNRMRIINALQKNISDLCSSSKDETLSHDMETPSMPKFTRKRKRGRPPLRRPASINYKSRSIERHSSSDDDDYYPSKENSFSGPSTSNAVKAHIVPRGCHRGGSRGRGGRGGHHSSANDSRPIVISETAQIPQILEMIQPFINKMPTQTTKVLIIPSTAFKPSSNLQESKPLEEEFQSSEDPKPSIREPQKTFNKESSLPSTSKQTKRRGRRHLLPNSSDEEPPEGPYTCSACQKTTDDYNIANAHVWQDHYGLARLNNNTPYKENEKIARLRKAVRKFNFLTCKNSFCKKIFKNESGFYYHFLTCGRKDPYVECEFCKKKLMPASLTAHIKNKHPDCMSKDESSSSKSSSEENIPEEAYMQNTSSGRIRRAACKARYVVRKFIREEKKSINKYSFPDDGLKDSDYESDKPLPKKKFRRSQEEPTETEYLASEEESDDEIDRNYKTNVTYYPENLSYPYRKKLHAWSGLYSIPPYLMSPEMEEQWQSDLVNQGHIACKEEGCGQTFSTIAEMQHHLLNCADKDNGWSCLICNTRFDHPRFLLFHLKSRHQDKIDHEVMLDNKPLLVPFPKAMDLSLKYHLENDSLEVFPEWMPQQDSWEYLPTGWDEHLPPETDSPFFRSSYESKWKMIKRFKADLPKRGTCNFTFFTGGPVKAIAWCPLPSGAFEKQYIALATDSSEIGVRYPYFADQTSNVKGLIQIWDCGYLTFRSASSLPTLSLAIVYDSGPIYDLCWCPSGCWEEAQAKEDPGFLPRLGLLAAAFNNGDIVIYSIPHPNFLEYPEFEDNDANKDNLPIWKVEPVLTLQSPGSGPSSFTKPSPCCHLSWLPTEGQKLLAAGYAKGTVALWDVASFSVIHPILQARPILTFLAHQHAVTGIQWCPQGGSRFLATCSIDRMVKIWDLDDPGFPLMTYKSGLLLDLHWIPHWCGVAAAQDDAFTLPNHTFFRDSGYFHYGSMLTAHNAPIWSLSLSEWLNAAVSCDHAGELVGLVLPSLDKCLNKPLSRRRLPLYRIQIEDLENEPVPQPLSEGSEDLDDENQASSVADVVSSLILKVEKEVSCENDMFSSIKESLSTTLATVIDNIKKSITSLNFNIDNEVDKIAAQKVEVLLDKLLCILEPMTHCLEEKTILSLLGSLTHVTTLIKHCHKESAATFRNVEGSALDVLLELGDKILGWLDSFSIDVANASSLLKQLANQNISAEEKRAKFLSILTKSKQDYATLKAKFGIVFKDHNLKDLKKIPRSEYQRLAKSETMNSPDYLNFPLNSITSVKWNPNLGSHLWLVSGGQVGLCRLTLVAGLYHPTMERTVKKAHTWFKNNSNR